MDGRRLAVACLSLADGRSAGELAGAWLVSYDPAGNGGVGDAAWSHDPSDAARFTAEEWTALYAAAPANRPLRSDGKPNRPIAVFNLAVVPVDPGRLPSMPPGDPAAPAAVVESEADFLKRLDKVSAAAEAAHAGEQVPTPRKSAQPTAGPDLSRPGGLADELRAMGLM
jgi:hypothetical protein